MDTVFLLFVGIAGAVLASVLISDSARPLSRLYFWMYMYLCLAGALLACPVLAIGFAQLAGPTFGGETLGGVDASAVFYGFAAGLVLCAEISIYLWARRMAGLGFGRWWVILLAAAFALAYAAPLFGAPLSFALLVAPGLMERRREAETA